MTPFRRLLACSAFVSLFCAAPVWAQDRPAVTQTLDGFVRPAAAVFSPDKSYLYVASHAHGEYGTLRAASFLSRLSVSGSGEVTVDQMRFVDALTAPIDMDFSPVRFGAVPQGAIFLLVGTPLVQDEAGRTLKDVSRVMIGFLVIDPRTGRLIKQVDLSPNSRIRLRGEDSLLAPSSLAFDKAGNLYIGEMGMGGHMFDRRQTGRPGIWRLPADAVAALLEDKAPAGAELIRTTSLPGDMCYRASDDTLFFLTNHTAGRPSGSVFSIPSSRYDGIASMETIVRELVALSGLQVTPAGRVLMIGNSGELLLPRGKKNSRPIRFRPQVDFSTPGKIGMIELADGALLVAVPEQSSDAGLDRGQRLRIVRLPPGY